ncbi:MAG: GDP-mannose mannosyl hydrolase [Desulfomonile tiedjei]|nr:GDP-mannose mannosyl hydrolase [Desulfomonile tiedjei]
MVNRNVSRLSDEEFGEVIRNAPLVSIDRVVRNPRNEVFLALRKNHPAKNYWFVPGGRILKNEAIDEAFQRLASTELGLELDFKDAHLLGAFDHFYETNRFGIEGFGTHYVVLGYEIKISKTFTLPENDEHSEYKWLDISDLLNDRRVHPNTKAFFCSPTVPNDSGMYRALMSHYVHYDRLFWSRTQVLLAIQGGALAAAYALRAHPLSSIIMIATILLVLMVLGLIRRDITSSRKNQEWMDKLANRIFSYNGAGRVISLRSDPKHPRLSGQRLISMAIICIVLVDIVLACLFIWKPNLFPPENSVHESKLMKQVEALQPRIDSLEKEVASIHKLPVQNSSKQEKTQPAKGQSQ